MHHRKSHRDLGVDIDKFRGEKIGHVPEKPHEIKDILISRVRALIDRVGLRVIWVILVAPDVWWKEGT
jgi:hypothetical protein